MTTKTLEPGTIVYNRADGASAEVDSDEGDGWLTLIVYSSHLGRCVAVDRRASQYTTTEPKR